MPFLSHQDAVTWLGPSAAVPRHKHHQQIVQVARQLVVSDRSAAGNHSSSQQLGPQTDQSREEDPKPYEEWQAVGRLSFCYNRRLHSALHNNCTIRSSISLTNKSPPLRAAQHAAICTSTRKIWRTVRLPELKTCRCLFQVCFVLC